MLLNAMKRELATGNTIDISRTWGHGSPSMHVDVWDGLVDI